MSDGVALGRETPSEVVLVSRLRTALERSNPSVPPEEIAAAVDDSTRDRSAMPPEHANREAYQFLKEGIKGSMADSDTSTSSGLRPPSPRRGEGTGGQKTERLRVIDWQDPAANDFLAVRQITFSGPLYTCRPDIVCFVNGLPLLLLEFKKPGVPAREAFDENINTGATAVVSATAPFSPHGEAWESGEQPPDFQGKSA